jgi:uncharacterized membrane protein
MSDDAPQAATVRPPWWPALVVLLGALLGLALAGYSTADYVAHLDRQLHDVHCSFIPGAAVDPNADNACKTAMYSSYSALLRDEIWGGVPISLFALGAFAFFAAFALYLLVSGARAPRRANHFIALAGVTPLLASIVMAVISATKLGSYCKTCVGIYIASAILAIGAVAAFVVDRRAARRALLVEARLPEAGSNVPPTLVDDADVIRPRPLGPMSLVVSWMLLLAMSSVTPAFAYRESVPSYEAHVRGCGTLADASDPHKALIHIAAAGARQPVHLVVDPLCPTCKAFHQRLISEGIFALLDTTLVLFPLDSECNWNLDTPLHPGACAVSRAVICGDARALEVLEWAYEQQDELVALAKSADGEAKLALRIEQRFAGMKACMESKATRLRLDETIRFGVRNKLPVSTPQLFVGSVRLCDEDSDIGLPYALRKLAPELSKK